ncbi:OmpA family protein [Aquisalimonas sp. APHAB1-3]|uniref:OmpA family protein n=1 Tax=Aquisalimonas sp. APHAB1-3 TaxID=3402080 RepID=UPI003AAAE923
MISTTACQRPISTPSGLNRICSKAGAAVLWAALLLLPAAAQSNEALPTTGQHYMASLSESSWYWERHANACHLMHAIPGFGLAVFTRAADGAVALRVYTGNPPAEAHTVDLWSAPRDWDASAVRRIGSVEGTPGPETFRFGPDMAVQVLRELERGAYPTLSFDDWHAPGNTLAVSLSNAGFRPKYRAFMRCQPSEDAQPVTSRRDERQSHDASNALTVLDGNAPDEIPEATDGVVSVTTRQIPPDATTITLESDNGLPPSPPSRLLARHGQAVIPADLLEAEREAEQQRQQEREGARRAAEAEARRAQAEEEARAAGSNDEGSGTDENGGNGDQDGVYEPAADVPDVVYFVSGDTGLTRTEQDRINAFVDALGEDSQATITVTGHTGSSAPEAYNEGLGRERANAVREYLVDRGIAENRIVVATAGSSNPAAEDDSPFEQAANRRARLHAGERD